MIFGEEDNAFMDPQPPQNPGQPQGIRLDISRTDTFYANFFALSGSQDELVLYFGANTPIPNATQPVVPVSHRLIMVPPNAKRLALALQQAIKAHEDRFGPIELPPPRRPPSGTA